MPRTVDSPGDSPPGPPLRESSIIDLTESASESQLFLERSLSSVVQERTLDTVVILSEEDDDTIPVLPHLSDDGSQEDEYIPNAAFEYSQDDIALNSSQRQLPERDSLGLKRSLDDSIIESEKVSREEIFVLRTPRTPTALRNNTLGTPTVATPVPNTGNRPKKKGKRRRNRS